MKIDRHTVSQAQETKSKLSPVIKLLEGLSSYHFQNNGDKFAEVHKFTNSLKEQVNNADSIITKGGDLYATRDKILINQASSAMMDCPNKIMALEKSLKNFEENRKHKVDDLVRKRYTPDEIEKILPSKDFEEQARDINNEISQLELDHAALKQFVASAPVYPVEIIKNTQFYKNFMEHEEHFRGVDNG